MTQEIPLTLRALRRAWWLVVVVAVLAGAAALIARDASPRDYTASADILVTPIAADDTTFLGVPALRQTGDTARVVQTAVGLLDTVPAAQRAAADLGAGWSQSSVRGRTDVQARGASNLVAVTAHAKKSADAANLANAFAKASLALRKEQLAGSMQSAVLQAYAQLRRQHGRRSGYADQLRVRIDALRVAQSSGDPSLSLSQAATEPTGRSGTPAWLVVVAAIIAGGALGFALILLIEAISPSRRNATATAGSGA